MPPSMSLTYEPASLPQVFLCDDLKHDLPVALKVSFLGIIFIELMTSDRKLKASREGSK